MSMLSYSRRRVLVTGAGGFIGEHLCRSLVEAGAIAHGIGRSSAPSSLVQILDGHWHQGDLSDPVVSSRVFEEIRPEVVFHLASRVTGSRELDVVGPTLDANLNAAVHLLTAAARNGSPRVVLAGSMDEPEDEPEDRIPSSPYSAAKYAQRAYALMFHALYGVPAVIARLFMVYGPNQKDVTKLIPYTTLSLLRGEAPKLSNGRRDIDWIYIDDAVEGLMLLGVAPDVAGRAIDLGTGTLATVRSVVERLAKLTNASVELPFGTLPDRPMERVRVARIGEAEALMGWRPRTALEEGLRRTVEWYRAQLERGGI